MVLLITVNWLTQLFLGAGHIQDIILDLERKADIFCCLFYYSSLFFRGTSKNCACHHRSFNKCRSLILINIINHLTAHRLAVIFHIHTLSAKHSVKSGLMGHYLQCLNHMCLTIWCICRVKSCKHHFISIIEKCHTAKNPHSFPINFMSSKTSSPVIVIIKSRKIIMDQ